MKNHSILIAALIMASCSPNAMADTKRDKATAEYKHCIDTVKRVASKNDDLVGMIARCREYALKHNQ